MDHQFGQIGLIKWQGRRNRRPKPGISPWTVLLVVSGLIGGLVLSAQAIGLWPWSVVLAGISAALVLLALAVQIVAVARSAIAWLLG